MRGLVRFIGQLHRAHRRAPRRGRQHAAPDVGKEDGVDQLGLAARELGHKGQHQAILAEAAAQAVQRVGGRIVEQLVLGQKARELGEPLLHRLSPGAQHIEPPRQHGGRQ